jgi:hypothetical protein
MRDRDVDDTVADFVLKNAMATDAQVESARAFQAECAARGTPLTFADALVKLGVITLAQRDNVEQKIQARREGGIHRLLHYELLRKLGQGGMGAVYLAEDTLADRKVAIKVLPRDMARDVESMKRFHREADAMGRLNHVNIVRAFSMAEDQGRHFFVMEYCEGETLDGRLKDGSTFPSVEATGLLIQIARGLKYAHEAGLIHRDIKPANVLVTRAGIAKILDLGLTKNIASGSSFLTHSGIAVGTPHYMSPEQVRGERDLDGRTDIYSLGATYYHMVTGDTPFHGSSAIEVVTQHLNEQIPDPRDIREEIPDGVVHVIRRMLAKKRDDRYRDCAELLEDLERVVDGLAPESREIDAALSSVAMPTKRRHVPRLPAPAPAPRPVPGHVKIGPWVVATQSVRLAGAAAALFVLVPFTLVLVRGRGARPGLEDDAAARRPSAPSREASPTPRSPAPAGGRPETAAMARETHVLEKDVRAANGERDYRRSQVLLDDARRRSPAPEWIQAVDRLTRETCDAAEGQYLRLKGKALDARRQGGADEVAEFRAEVVRWGIPRFVEDLDRSLNELR